MTMHHYIYLEKMTFKKATNSYFWLMLSDIYIFFDLVELCSTIAATHSRHIRLHYDGIFYHIGKDH